MSFFNFLVLAILEILRAAFVFLAFLCNLNSVTRAMSAATPAAAPSPNLSHTTKVGIEIVAVETTNSDIALDMVLAITFLLYLLILSTVLSAILAIARPGAGVSRCSTYSVAWPPTSVVTFLFVSNHLILPNEIKDINFPTSQPAIKNGTETFLLISLCLFLRLS